MVSKTFQDNSHKELSQSGHTVMMLKIRSWETETLT